MLLPPNLSDPAGWRPQTSGQAHRPNCMWAPKAVCPEDLFLSLHGLMGLRSRCGRPCPQGGRCEVRGGGWQAKAGDSQGKGDSMKDRQQVDRLRRHRVERTWPSETLESRGQWRLCRSHHAVGEKGLAAGGQARASERAQVKEAAGRAVVLPPQPWGRWVNTTLDGAVRGLRDGEG